MKDVRIDQDGELRCWNCGAKGFTEKRTLRSKAAFGVGALLTKKKLKCQVCGEYSDTGNAKPYTGPESARHRAPAAGGPASAVAPAGDGTPLCTQAQRQFLKMSLRGKVAEMPDLSQLTVVEAEDLLRSVGIDPVKLYQGGRMIGAKEQKPWRDRLASGTGPES